MINPFFDYFSRNRQTNERLLFNPSIGRIKYYPGTKMVSLPKPAPVEQSFSQLVADRISEGDFSHTMVSLPVLSSILYWSAAELGKRRDGQGHQKEKIQRPHPSGGAKYPLEIYICADRVSEIERGLYHYRPDTHGLEFVTPLDTEKIHKIKSGYLYPFAQQIPAFIIFSFVLERSMPKYGALAYKLGLIESGHIAQNVYLLAAAHGVKCTALGGHNEELLNNLLMLDGYNETTFYTVGLGQKEDDTSKQ